MSKSQVKIEITGDNSKLAPVMADSEKKVTTFGQRVEATGAKMQGAGKTMMMGLTAPIAALGVTSVKAFSDAEEASAQVRASFDSTGAAAWGNADAIMGLADELERKHGVDGDAIKSGQSLLLTFTNVQNAAGEGNDIFDQTTQVMADMSVKMGTDAKSSAMLLGKALNDPIKGMGALTKAGVQFTAEQKAQITGMVEAGDVMGAQKLILAELTKQFGGSAAAFGETAAGGVAKAKFAFENVQEEIGERLMPLVEDLTGVIYSGLDVWDSWSDGQKDVAITLAGVAAAAGPVVYAGGKILSAGQSITSTFKTVSGAVSSAGSSIATGAKNWVSSVRASHAAGDGWAKSITSNLNPAVVGATIAVGVGLAAYEAWSTNVKRVQAESELLSTTLIDQGEKVIPTLTAAFKEILTTRDSFDESFAQTGVTIGQVTGIVNQSTGDFDRFRQIVHDASESPKLLNDALFGTGELARSQGLAVDDLRDRYNNLSPALQAVVKRLLEMEDLDGNSFREFVDAAADLDQAAMLTEENLAGMGKQFETTVGRAKMSADAIALLDTVLGKGHPTLEEAQAAWLQLAATNKDAALAAGQVVDPTLAAAGAIDEETASAEEAKAALDLYLQSMTNLFSPIAAVTSATDRQTQAQDAATKALKEHGAQSPEYVAASHAVVSANLEKDASLARLKAGLKDGTVSSEDYLAVLRRMRDQGQLNAQQYNIEAWALAGAVGQANTWKGLGSGKFTAIADVTQAQLALAALMRSIAAIRQGQSNIMINVKAKQLDGGLAAGGPFGRGRYLVGEQGPEVVEFTGAGRVIPNDQISAYLGALLGTGGSSGSTTLTTSTSTSAVVSSLSKIELQVNFNAPVSRGHVPEIMDAIEEGIQRGLTGPRLKRLVTSS